MPDFIQDKIAQHDLVNAKADLPSNKLLLEASLLGGGIKDGFLARRDQALENPGLTTLELVGTAAIGAGLTIAHRAGGRWGIAADLAATGFTCLALGDAARRLIPTACAMSDTYMNPKNYSENRALVAKNLGTACFDYPLMAAGGFLGAKAVDLAPNPLLITASRFSGQVESNTAELLKLSVPVDMENRTVLNLLDTKPPVEFRSYRTPFRARPAIVEAAEAALRSVEKPASALGSSELGVPLCDRAAVLAGLEAARKMPEGQPIWRSIEKPAPAIEDLGAPLCDRAAVLAALEKLFPERSALNGSFGESPIFQEPITYFPHEIPREPFNLTNPIKIDNLTEAMLERRNEW